VLIFHPVPVATDSDDEEGHLAIYDGKLVAVFVRLAGAEHMEERGRFYVEASFGALSGLPTPTFASLNEAARWLDAELGDVRGHGTRGGGYARGRPVAN
jgi:hypothetical protein